jgi:hypothetical protein
MEPKTHDFARASDFMPANNTIKQPETGSEMLCPVCEKPFAKYGRYDGIYLVTDIGVLPKTTDNV